MNVAFAIRLTAAIRVKPFMSKELTRYYLNGVFVDVSAGGGAVCVATDGHRLGVRHDPEGICNTPTIFTLPNEIKLPPRLIASPWLVGISTSEGKGHVSVVEAGGKGEDTAEQAIARVEDCTLRIGRAFIDGKFPDWRRVIPKPGKDDAVRAFNTDYVRGFGKYMTLRGADAASPHLIEMADDPQFIGVLMPMRAEGKGVLPVWLSDPVAKKKAA